MKIASLVSGLLTIALLILFFTGVINFNNNIIESLVKGNHAYAASNYDKALEAYKKGLSENSEEPRLNYNSGQASYRLNKYEDAVKYYVKTSDTPDKYINSGNSSLKLADSINDAAQKQQYYQKALETYKQGIIAFPENIPLKYNYEYVKSKLDDQQNNNEDNKNKNDQNNQNKQDQQNQDKNGQNDQNSQDQQNQDKNGQNDQNKQDEDSGQNKESEQDKQNGNSGKQDNKDQNQENKENQQSSQTDQNKEQNNAQTGDKKEEKDGQKNASQAQESDSSKSKQEDSNIAQVLRMLERQEEDSLKNNQEIKSKAKGDEYDW